MTVNDIVTIITSVGFPIVACCAMAWFVKYMNDQHRSEVQKLNEQHNEEMQKVTAALNNNTLALQKLCDRLGDDK